jgi:predicted small lipoprotein YifL
MKTFLLILVSVLLLTACGQKGPLYLPQPENPPASSEKAPANPSND